MFTAVGITSLRRPGHDAVHTGSLRHPHHTAGETRCFYVDALGLEVGARPPLTVPGYWLYADGRPVVHRIECGARYATDVFGQPIHALRGPAGPGVDHLAFRASGLSTLRAHLTALGIPYRELAMPAADLHQVFVVDPNGVIAELNFQASLETA